MQIALRSLRRPVEVLETTSVNDGIEVRWAAFIRQPFTQVEGPTVKSWQPGESFGLRILMKQIGAEWRIVGF